MYYQSILQRLNIMDYFLTEIKRTTSDFVDCWSQEYLQMNLYLQYLKNFMNLNVRNVGLHILGIILIILSTDRVQFNLYPFFYNIAGLWGKGQLALKQKIQRVFPLIELTNFYWSVSQRKKEKILSPYGFSSESWYNSVRPFFEYSKNAITC